MKQNAPGLYDRILLLKQSAVFGQVKTEDLKVVAQSLQEERYFSGDRVFDIGEYGDCMYIIQAGRVGIALEKINRSHPAFVTELGKGECFGEMNLFDDLPRSASACVIDDAILLSLEKSRLRALIINYPELGLGMLKALSLRLRQANSQTRQKPHNRAGSSRHLTDR
ncbi:MAG TPA: cyclic nucleotide-binding domain-containing protein [Thiotrichales bacterium]|nr:cyclic nucleotide-binding domain-containing protein [Thiotrichales bacterium]